MRRNGRIPVGPASDHASATLEEIRAVWAAVSLTPSASVRCLAERSGISGTKAHYILHFLARAGYLEKVPYCTGWLVRIPLVEIEKERKHASKFQSPSAQVRARHPAMPALRQNVPAHPGQGAKRQTEVPVLQAQSRQSTSEIRNGTIPPKQPLTEAEAEQPRQIVSNKQERNL